MLSSRTDVSQRHGMRPHPMRLDIGPRAMGGHAGGYYTDVSMSDCEAESRTFISQPGLPQVNGAGCCGSTFRLLALALLLVLAFVCGTAVAFVANDQRSAAGSLHAGGQGGPSPARRLDDREEVPARAPSPSQAGYRKLSASSQSLIHRLARLGSRADDELRVARVFPRWLAPRDEDALSWNVPAVLRDLVSVTASLALVEMDRVEEGV